MTPKQRIAEMKRRARESRITQPTHICSGCGEEFRYIINLNKHKLNCLDYKYGKEE